MKSTSYPLRDIATVTSGQSAPQGSECFAIDGFPFVRAGSLGFLIKGEGENKCEKINEKVAPKFRLRLFPADTILFAKSGMSAKIGRVYRLKKPCYVVSHLAAVIPGPGVVPSYLQRWFEKFPPSRLIPNEAYPSIRISEIERLQIPLPPLPEQKRIAAILDKADAIRRKRQQAIKLADEFLRSVFLYMFGDPMTNPKGWTRRPIKELGKVVTGNTPSRKRSEYYGKDIEWIKSDNINSPFHFLTVASESLSTKGKEVGRTAPAFSILITCIAGTPDCIGNAALADREVAFNQQINAIMPFKGTDPYFLYTQLLVGKRLVRDASTNSMKGLVSKSKFENISLLAPPEESQKEFRGIFTKYMVSSEIFKRSKMESNALFNSLAQRSFRGEV